MSGPGLSRERDRLDGAAAPVGLEPLLGSWRVFAEETNGISRADISAAGGRVSVAVQGEGPDVPSEWGTAEVRVFAEHVSGGPAWGFRADFERGDATVRLNGYLNRGLLAIEAATTFTDGEQPGYFTRTFLFRP